MRSATFFAAQVDFTDAGDLLIFADEDQISALERDMKRSGVLEGSKMAMTFNMLRSNDLIWSYVVSNYLKGKAPPAFDFFRTGIQMPRGCRRPTTPFICATAISKIVSPPAPWC